MPSFIGTATSLTVIQFFHVITTPCTAATQCFAAAPWACHKMEDLRKQRSVADKTKHLTRDRVHPTSILQNNASKGSPASNWKKTAGRTNGMTRSITTEHENDAHNECANHGTNMDIHSIHERGATSRWSTEWSRDVWDNQAIDTRGTSAGTKTCLLH